MKILRAERFSRFVLIGKLMRTFGGKLNQMFSFQASCRDSLKNLSAVETKITLWHRSDACAIECYAFTCTFYSTSA